MLEVSNKLFRFTGDALMVSARAITIKKIMSFKSVSGLSLKTQLIYLFVYILRYLDLYKNLHNIFTFSFSGLELYNSLMKVAFLVYQVYIVAKILRSRDSYTKNHDTFPITVLLAAAFVASYAINYHVYKKVMIEYCYTLSLVLEAVALLPQLVMAQASGEIELHTALYITCLGLYRFFYLIFFMVRRFFLHEKVDTLIIMTSLIQSILFYEFFAIFISFIVTRKKGENQSKIAY